MTFTESVIEEAALAWLESLGWKVLFGAEIAPRKAVAELDSLLPRPICGEVECVRRRNE